MRIPLPESIKAPLREWRDEAQNYFSTRQYHGTGRYCPVCEKESNRFETYKDRQQAMCVRCYSLERHRFLWLYLKRTDLFDGKPKKMLHVAPEKCLRPRLQKALGGGYLTADLFDSAAMVKMDIHQIQYPNDAFDVIYCSHVLEHVADDRRAMREFHRVLKPTGWAILLVPIIAEKSHEDPSITDPQERLRLYGQADHVRAYGRDYIDRLKECGFKVTETRVSDFAADVERMGLQDAGEIYFCRKY